MSRFPHALGVCCKNTARCKWHPGQSALKPPLSISITHPDKGSGSRVHASAVNDRMYYFSGLLPPSDPTPTPPLPPNPWLILVRCGDGRLVVHLSVKPQFWPPEKDIFHSLISLSPCFLPPSLPPSFSFRRQRRQSVSPSLSLSHTHTLSLSLIYTHTHTLSLSLAHSLSLPVSPSLFSHTRPSPRPTHTHSPSTPSPLPPSPNTQTHKHTRGRHGRLPTSSAPHVQAYTRFVTQFKSTAALYFW